MHVQSHTCTRMNSSKIGHQYLSSAKAHKSSLNPPPCSLHASCSSCFTIVTRVLIERENIHGLKNVLTCDTSICTCIYTCARHTQVNYTVYMYLHTIIRCRTCADKQCQRIPTLVCVPSTVSSSGLSSSCPAKYIHTLRLLCGASKSKQHLCPLLAALRCCFCGR